MVKIISWSDGLKYGGVIKEVDKVTLKEWKTYCSRYIKTNTSHDKTRVDQDLQRTKEAIESFGGFEKTN